MNPNHNNNNSRNRNVFYENESLINSHLNISNQIDINTLLS